MFDKITMAERMALADKNLQIECLGFHGATYWLRAKSWPPGRYVSFFGPKGLNARKLLELAPAEAWKGVFGGPTIDLTRWRVLEWATKRCHERGFFDGNERAEK